MQLPGTVGETAEEVDRRGGKGVAVQVDHADDGQVAALFDQIQREQGRIDILVNNVFALPEDLTEPGPFWEKPLCHWDMVDVGVRSNYVAARHAATMMVPQTVGTRRRDLGLRRGDLHLRRRLRHVQVGGRPDGAGHGRRARAVPRRLAVAVAGPHLHRAGRTQLAAQPRNDEADGHRPRGRMLARVPRPGDRGAGHRSGRDDSGRAAASSPPRSRATTASPISTARSSRRYAPNAASRSGARSRRPAMDVDRAARIDRLLDRQDILDCLTLLQPRHGPLRPRTVPVRVSS